MRHVPPPLLLQVLAGQLLHLGHRRTGGDRRPGLHTRRRCWWHPSMRFIEVHHGPGCFWRILP